MRFNAPENLKINNKRRTLKLKDKISLDNTQAPS